ncbi:helix-turn-helix transcriptional regulator [Spirillospora sp. NPDC052269]
MPRQARPLYPHSLRTHFGGEVRFLREKGELSLAGLAEVLGCTPQWIWALEQGGEKPSLDFADDCDTYWKTDGRFRRLVEAHERELKLPRPPANFPRFKVLEDESSVLYMYEALLITGLFQTERYARAVLDPIQPPASIDQLVATRMARQAVLTKKNAPRLWVIHDERALRCMIGEREVMREQLEHLIQVCQLPNVTLQVVPRSVRGLARAEGSFTILKFPDERPDMVYVDAGSADQVLDDPAHADEYHVRYDLIRAHALSVEQTLELIKSILESL